MDELRARAYLDLLLGKDSRPRDPAAADPGPANLNRTTLTGRRAERFPPGSPGGSHLIVPLATLTDLASRPGELSGLGPVDPWLARDLAAAAAHNPKTTWCVTVTDQHGHAIGHGCARPEPESHRKRAGPGAAGRGRVLLHPGQPGRAARRIRHLAAAHPGRRARPDHHPRVPRHRPLRPPAPGPRPRSRRQAPAPVPDPARHLHQPRLPAARRPVRLRAQHPVRGGRTDLPV